MKNIHFAFIIIAATAFCVPAHAEGRTAGPADRTQPYTGQAGQLQQTASDQRNQVNTLIAANPIVNVTPAVTPPAPPDEDSEPYWEQTVAVPESYFDQMAVSAPPTDPTLADTTKTEDLGNGKSVERTRDGGGAVTKEVFKENGVTQQMKEYADGKLKKQTDYQFKANGTANGRIENEYIYDAAGKLTMRRETGFSAGGKKKYTKTYVPLKKPEAKDTSLIEGTTLN